MTQVLRPCVDSVTRFIKWWTAELTGCLPERIRPRFAYNRKNLVVLLSGDRVTLERRNGHQDAELGQFDLTRTDPVNLRKIIKKITRKARLHSAQVTFCLNGEQVLRRTVQLPIAAMENLREVLGFEMDRYTPFNVQETFFDFAIVGTDPTRKRVTVDLAVTTVDAVNRVFDVAKLLDMEPACIGLAAESGSKDTSFNFLPAKKLKVHGPMWRGFTTIVALGLAILLANAIYLPIKFKQDAVRLSDERLIQARAQAIKTDRLKEQFDQLLERSNFVYRQKHALSRVTELIDEVTRLLPDDTWLLQFDLKEDTLKLTGYSSKALALLEQLEASQMLSSVRFTSPVTEDARLGVDRFAMTALVAQKQ
jgi:general secretion pathway protein L